MNEKKPTSCRLRKPAIILAFFMIGMAIMVIIFTFAIPGFGPGPTGGKTGTQIGEIVGSAARMGKGDVGTGTATVRQGLRQERGTTGTTISETDSPTEKGPPKIAFSRQNGLYFAAWAERHGDDHKIIGTLIKIIGNRMIKISKPIADGLPGGFVPKVSIQRLTDYSTQEDWFIVAWDETSSILAAKIFIISNPLDFDPRLEIIYPPDGGPAEPNLTYILNNPKLASDGNTIILSLLKSSINRDLERSEEVKNLRTDLVTVAFDPNLQPEESSFCNETGNTEREPSFKKYDNNKIMFNEDLESPGFVLTYSDRKTCEPPTPFPELLDGITANNLGIYNDLLIDYVCNRNLALNQPLITVVSRFSGREYKLLLLAQGEDYPINSSYAHPFRGLEMWTGDASTYYLTCEGYSNGLYTDIHFVELKRDPNMRSLGVLNNINVSNSLEESIYPALSFGNAGIGLVWLEITNPPIVHELSDIARDNQFSSKNYALISQCAASTQAVPNNYRYSAIDGEEDTSWKSSAEDTQPTLTIKLPERRYINRINIKGGENISEYYLRVKNPTGADFVQIYNGNTDQPIECEPIKTDEVEIRCTPEQEGIQVGIKEVEVYYTNNWQQIVKFALYDTATGRIITPGENLSPRITMPRQGNQPIDIEHVNQRAVSFIVEAVDPDGDEITLSAQNLPPGATLRKNPHLSRPGFASGHFYWEPNWSSIRPGYTYNIGVTASDPLGGKDDKIVTLRIKRPNNYRPLITGPPQENINLQKRNNMYLGGIPALEQFEFRIYAHDLDNDNVTINITNAPPGAVFSPPESRSGTNGILEYRRIFSWTPGIAEIGRTYKVDFSAVDNRGARSNDTITLQIRIGRQPRTRGTEQPSGQESEATGQPRRYQGVVNIARNAAVMGPTAAPYSSSNVNDDLLEERPGGRGVWVSNLRNQATITLDWSRNPINKLVLRNNNKLVIYPRPGIQNKIKNVKIKIWYSIISTPGSPEVRELREINLGELPAAGGYEAITIPMPNSAQESFIINKMEITLSSDRIIGLSEVQLWSPDR